ncbi:MAG: hypothetical protein AAF483_14360, partial [Planctomycetota bacterium]
NETPFSKESLQGLQLLVIANAIARENEKKWILPTPSAFTDAEIQAVRDWVAGGGSLMLIADHMPFPGAAEKLAKEFGVTEWRNGFAAYDGKLGPLRFEPVPKSETASKDATSSSSNQLMALPGKQESVPWVTTFTGSCFKTEEAAFHPLLRLGEKALSIEPKQAWQFNANTQRQEVPSYLQGAVREFGKGRVAIFGEAAMFTAQASGGAPFGLSDPKAKHNQAFLLQTVLWLTPEPK